MYVYVCNVNNLSVIALLNSYKSWNNELNLLQNMVFYILLDTCQLCEMHYLSH